MRIARITSIRTVAAAAAMGLFAFAGAQAQTAAYAGESPIRMPSVGRRGE